MREDNVKGSVSKDMNCPNWFEATLTVDKNSNFEDNDNSKESQVDIEQTVSACARSETAETSDQHKQDSQDDQTCRSWG